HAQRLSILPIVHALLADEVGIDTDTSAAHASSERRALAAVDRVIAVGDSLIPRLAADGFDRSRIAVVKPGTDRAPLARGSWPDGPLHLVTVATLNPGKGHDVLFQALARTAQPPWRLTCAGSATRHARTAERLQRMLTALRLADRVTLTGELDTRGVADLYDRTDLFVLPTLAETHPLSV